MADGIAAGQWIEYVGSGSTEALRVELTELEGINADRPGLGVSPVGDFYRFAGHSDRRSGCCRHRPRRRD